MKFKIFFKQFFCSHVNKTEILEKGKHIYTQYPPYEYGVFREYTLDIVKETCYKCGKEHIKYKRNFDNQNVY